MANFFIIILIMVGALIADLLGRLVPKIPLAFVQISLGILLSFLPIFHHFEMEPELFLIIVIAPLLFNDSQNANFKKVFKTFKSTFALSVILAVIMILIIGVILNWQFALFTLPLAILLGAIVTPTDAVAVKSIAANSDVPEHVMQSLEYESLFNDASGIVIFDLALAVLITHHFSLGAGILHFGKVFFGGLLIGLICGWLIIKVRSKLLAREISDTNIMIPISILTPFAVYLLAEHVGVSGILAVVATGMVHSLEKIWLRLTSTKMQVVHKEVWNIISDTLNGFVFIILGLLLPGIVTTMLESSAHLLILCLIIASLIYVIMFTLRYLFVQFNLADQHWPKARHRFDSLVFALGGVHGTITLAMAFSLPLTINGQALPYRNEILFMAATVIMLSLLVPAIVFPVLLPSKQELISTQALQQARIAMIEYAVQELHDANIFDPMVIAVVHENLLTQNGFVAGNRKVIKNLLHGLNNANLHALEQAIDDGRLPENAETLINRTIQADQSHFFWRIKRQILRWRIIKNKQHYITKLEPQAQVLKTMQKIIKTTTENYLADHENQTNLTEIGAVRTSYLTRWNKLVKFQTKQQHNLNLEVLNEAYVQGFQLEYQFLSDSVANKTINNAIAKELADVIANSELVQFQTHYFGNA